MVWKRRRRYSFLFAVVSIEMFPFFLKEDTVVLIIDII